MSKTNAYTVLVEISREILKKRKTLPVYINFAQFVQLFRIIWGHVGGLPLSTSQLKSFFLQANVEIPKPVSITEKIFRKFTRRFTLLRLTIYLHAVVRHRYLKLYFVEAHSFHSTLRGTEV